MIPQSRHLHLLSSSAAPILQLRQRRQPATAMVFQYLIRLPSRRHLRIVLGVYQLRATLTSTRRSAREPQQDSWRLRCRHEGITRFHAFPTVQLTTHRLDGFLAFPLSRNSFNMTHSSRMCCTSTLTSAVSLLCLKWLVSTCATEDTVWEAFSQHRTHKGCKDQRR